MGITFTIALSPQGELSNVPSVKMSKALVKNTCLKASALRTIKAFNRYLDMVKLLITLIKYEQYAQTSLVSMCLNV